MTMPAVVFTVNGQIALEDRPTPTLRPDQVLVEVDLRRICGSDLHASQLPQVYRGDCILGHESTGRVAAVGDDDAEWAIGQRSRSTPTVAWTALARTAGQRGRTSVGKPLWRRRWVCRPMEHWHR
jgi:threonine dehydrogenase-like Zn-dependent dehydrogenase